MIISGLWRTDFVSFLYLDLFVASSQHTQPHHPERGLKKEILSTVGDLSQKKYHGDIYLVCTIITVILIFLNWLIPF